MSAEDVVEMAGVDPTPINHPVENDVLDAAASTAAQQVADASGGDEAAGEDDPSNPEPRKRIRRVGKIEVSRKVPRIELNVAPDTELEAAAADNSDPIRQEAAARVLAAEAAIPKVISKHDEKWNHMFEKLIEFKKIHKHTSVPQMYLDSPRLGRWVHYQRVEYWVYQDTGGGKITPERIARLESIGFQWNPQDAQWQKMFERLKEYRASTGHCKVPKGYANDTELANWVRNQRLEHANLLKGRQSRMNTSRYHQLDDIGFKWSKIKAEKIVNPLPPREAKPSQTTTTVGEAVAPVLPSTDPATEITPVAAVTDKVAETHTSTTGTVEAVKADETITPSAVATTEKDSSDAIEV